MTRRQRRAALCLHVLTIAVLACTAPATASEVTRPIKVSPDNHFLMQEDGAPFFWLGDTGWSLVMRLNREDADLYLKTRAAQGYNIIQAVAFGGPADGIRSPNAYGELPLLNENPATPNPKYFAHVDWVVDRAAHYGLRIAMLPTWGAAQIGGWIGGVKSVITRENGEAYGRFLGERYKDKGVLWIFGGDTNPVGAGEVVDFKAPEKIVLTDYRPIYDALARGIELGEGRRPFITFHITCCAWSGAAEPRTSLYLGQRSWLTMNMLQSSHFRDPTSVMKLTGVAFAWDSQRNYDFVHDEYYSHPTRPVIDGEPRYEDLVVDVESDPKIIAINGYWSGYDARNAGYHAVFAGAAGHTYGNHSVWQFYDPEHNQPVQAARKDLPWQQAMHRPGAESMRYLRTLMLSRPYFTRIPDQSLIIGEQGEKAQHLQGTRDRLGSYAMVYVPEGRPVTVDMTRIAGPKAVAWWYDPRTGDATRMEGSFPTTGQRTFAAPTQGPETDWVLVIDDEAKAFAVPGAVK
jgi:hypothetical protein